MTEQRKAYAYGKWEARKERLGEFGLQKQQELESLAGEEKDWMVYLYATLPLSDLVNYTYEDFLPYVSHALMLKQQDPWNQDLSEGMFTDYVFYPRINTEDIEECRQLFYEELHDRVKDLSLMQAVLETNYWCQEKATYQQADDRTKSAATVFRSGCGRCGEESTFTVTALRSLGIPARQIYAPWWSHCDDNHAWVEVYVDGQWHFLGACEPQQILDAGWFTNASSRSMFMISRTFTGASSQEDLRYLYGDKASRFHVEEGVTMEIVTDLYAKVAPLTVEIKLPNGRPAAGCAVHFQILNMAEMMDAAVINADENGCVSIETGLGNINIHAAVAASKDSPMLFAEKIIMVPEEGIATTIVLEDVSKETSKSGSWEAFDFYAPLDMPIHPGIQSDEQKAERDARHEHGAKLRNERIESFYDEERAKPFSAEIRQLLHQAAGNFDEIEGFLSHGALGDELWRQALVKSLTKKDLSDAKRMVLEDHLICALPFVSDYPTAIFTSYVLNPRVFNETLTPYRAFIQNFFDEKTKKSFVRDPHQIMHWIEDNMQICYNMDYKDLYNTPAASLSSRLTGTVGYKILFVAICRSLGIAARLNPISSVPEFLKKDHFIPAEEKKAEQKANLELSMTTAADWIYRQTFTVGKLGQDGLYTRIDVPAAVSDRAFRCEIEAGSYRVITVNRLPNGHMYGYCYRFTAKKGDDLVIALKKRSVDLKETLSKNAIVDFHLMNEKGERIEASSVLQKPVNIMMWLEESKEPTEHILNEMMEQEEDFADLKADIFFILRDPKELEQVTLHKALSKFPRVKILYDNSQENVNTLGRRMYVDPEKLPLVLVMADGLTGIYASSGYNVGLGGLLVRIVEAMQS